MPRARERLRRASVELARTGLKRRLSKVGVGLKAVALNAGTKELETLERDFAAKMDDVARRVEAAATGLDAAEH